MADETASMNEAATAAKENLDQSITWKDGFAFALPVATNLFISLGYMVGAMGALTAIVLCVAIAGVAFLQNKIFAEMASMFPDRSGGIPVFISEGFDRCGEWIGPTASIAYWMGWAFVPALVGVSIGAIVEAQWLGPLETPFFAGKAFELSTTTLVAVCVVIAGALLTLNGISVAAAVSKLVGLVFIPILLLLALAPLFGGDFQWSNLGNKLDWSWQSIVTASVWAYLATWGLYATEICSAFTPEYRNKAADARRAMLSATGFLIAAFVFVPLSAVGLTGEATVANNPATYYSTVVELAYGNFAGVVTLVICAALFIITVSALADSGRTLYGMSEQRRIVGLFKPLNAKGEPINAVLVTTALNLLLVVFLKNPVSLLIASNVGYLLAITLAVLAFILLRRHRPEAHRPIRLGSHWITIGLLIVTFNAFLLVVGAANPELSYSGSYGDVLFGIAVPIVGYLLFVLRPGRADEREKSS